MASPSEGIEWLHGVVAGVAAILGAAGGFIGGVWRVARIEPSLKLKMQHDLGSMENDMREQITLAEHLIVGKIEEAASNFDETLKALRQKINDVELEMVRGYVSRPYFDEFRREYREDMRMIMTKLDERR